MRKVIKRPTRRTPSRSYTTGKRIPAWKQNLANKKILASNKKGKSIEEVRIKNPKLLKKSKVIKTTKLQKLKNPKIRR